MAELTRRNFIKGAATGAAVGLTAAAASSKAWAGANDKI
ncbi:MAG: twin-arginine translocation signal domain-containing protein, partial [Candidatus Hydrogenedentes bacterium]|nr:twin-arginine translocation signal domain-containing protein [Candidatus Hydrogenedentota bacterium]